MKGITKHIFQSVLVLGLLLAGEGVMWGGSYYAKVTAKVSGGEETGHGKVYVNTADEEATYGYISEATSTSESGTDATFYVNVKPDDGWHFDSWEDTHPTNHVTEFDTSKGKTTLKARRPTSDGTTDYEVTASFAEDFYTHLTTAHDGNGTAKPTITENAYQHAATSNTGMTYNVTAGAAKDGYHFKSWTITNGNPGTSNDDPVIITVKTSQTGGQSNATECVATAKYVLDEYYAKLNVIAGEHGSASVTGNPKSTTTKGGYVTFDIVATPDEGYHLKSWEVTSGSGDFGSTTATSTTFTAKAADNYDEENAKTYEIKANFEVDQFNAKLTTAVSSKSDASSSTAKVSSDNIDWSTEKTAASGTSGGDVTFHVKAEPATGFKFVGWATADNTDNPSDYVPNLGASGDYTVKSHTTQGETKEYQLFAVFKKEYSITIKAGTETGKGRIVFKVVNKDDSSIKYRISVPVGDTKVLKDVVPGDYTITPETKWSWSYNVSEAQNTNYDDNNMSTNEFTVTPKSTTKKHDEVGKTVTPGA